MNTKILNNPPQVVSFRSDKDIELKFELLKESDLFNSHHSVAIILKQDGPTKPYAEVLNYTTEDDVTESDILKFVICCKNNNDMTRQLGVESVVFGKHTSEVVLSMKDSIQLSYIGGKAHWTTIPNNFLPRGYSGRQVCLVHKCDGSVINASVQEVFDIGSYCSVLKIINDFEVPPHAEPLEKPITAEFVDIRELFENLGKVIFIRGPSGCGKTTLANKMVADGKAALKVEADDFFIEGRLDELRTQLLTGTMAPTSQSEYKFDRVLISQAHTAALCLVVEALLNGKTVIVSNTNVRTESIFKQVHAITHRIGALVDFKVIDLTEFKGDSNAPVEVRNRMFKEFEPWHSECSSEPQSS